MKKQKNPPLDMKSRVRQDIAKYEASKTRKNLALSGALAGTGASAVGFARKDPRIAIPGISVALLSGFMHGKAKRDGQRALNRLKRFYDLRERPPMQQKTAVVGGALEAITGVLGATDLTPLSGGFSHWISEGLKGLGVAAGAAGLAQSTAPFAVDIALLPTVGKKVTKSTREHAYAAAKQQMGMPLSPDEAKMRAKSLLATAKIRSREDLSSGPYRSFMRFWDQYKGPKATGGQIGERAGSILKTVDEISPTLARSALEAIKGDQGAERLGKQLKLRGARYQQAAGILDSAVDVVPGLRSILRMTGKGGKSVLSDLVENPRTAKVMAEQVKKTVESGVRGVKGGLGVGALALGASLIGQHRKQHPLAGDKLPDDLIKQDAGFWDGFGKAAFFNITGAPAPSAVRGLAPATPPAGTSNVGTQTAASARGWGTGQTLGARIGFPGAK